MTFAAAFRTSALGILALGLAACGGDADNTEGEGGALSPNGAGSASSDLESVVEERQANYEAISDSFKAIRTQLEGSNPDFAAIGQAADEINTRAKRIPDYFPAGTSVEDGYDTEALPAIWERPREFDQRAQALIDASAELSGVAVTADQAAVTTAVEKLGSTCKACHDRFRMDD